MAVMITIEPVRGSEVSGTQVEVTHRLLRPTVTHSWQTEKRGAVWIINVTPDQAAGLRDQLRIIWESEAVEVQWWPTLPVPRTVVPTES
jgi:hypothetical protein